MFDMEGGDLDVNEERSYSFPVRPEFSSGRRCAPSKQRSGHARRLSYLNGGRNERVTRGRPCGRPFFIWSEYV